MQRVFSTWRLYSIAALLFSWDQLTKTWIVANVPVDNYFSPIPVVPGFFYIVHIYNRGAAWGILDGYSGWLAVLGIAALFLVYHFRHELGLKAPPMQVSFGLLCGGILGNITDRVRFGHVVDFLDFHLGTYRWPAFNIADCGITVGVTLYVLYNLKDLLPLGGRSQQPSPKSD